MGNASNLGTMHNTSSLLYCYVLPLQVLNIMQTLFPYAFLYLCLGKIGYLQSSSQLREDP